MGDFRVFLFLAATTLTYVVVAEDDSAPVIKTSTGLVAGLRTSIGGKGVDLYLGIPYAQAPVGPLRFGRPVPAKPWHGTYAATEKPKPCPQNTHYHTDQISFYYTNYSEDCLYLNVRKPASSCQRDSCGNKQLPVVVLIHGTDFQWGDSGLFLHDGGNFAALTDTIFVSFNYRLNVFGFLSAGNEELPGNWGLWDQNLALTWVQRNIGYFGGDSKEVTIIGHGAGATSAGFHAISPHSVGLFKRLVLLSGSPMTIVTQFSSNSEGALFLYSVMKAVPRFDDLLILDYRSAVQKADTKDVIAVLRDILGDGLFVCPATFFADEASEQKIPVFRYVFDYRPSFSVWPTWFRASHGDDIAFDLGSLVFLGDERKFTPGIRAEDYDRFKQLKYTAQERRFMEAMVTSVSQFVKTGRPMIPGSKEAWPRYSSFDPAYINIIPGNITREHGPKQDICAMWKRILIKQDSATGNHLLQKKKTELGNSRRSTATDRPAPQATGSHVPTAGSASFSPHYFVLKTVTFLLLAEIASCS
ncbi:hypothetical protein HPB50_007403 [Hyalomma asiaticum]|uniref:Uncharacterized protein n=1 Tax=Hyalomma asiaticum TaxID=266040 RepID=A0ACB7S1X8_HYAAI|nr:hypothetical protein HPB50_007403 [Hyalomma asiaticum]